MSVPEEDVESGHRGSSGDPTSQLGMFVFKVTKTENRGSLVKVTTDNGSTQVYIKAAELSVEGHLTQ